MSIGNCAVKWLALALLWPSLCFPTEIPDAARLHRTELSREAWKVWGRNAPIATLAAQVHQESGWRQGLTSRTGARGLTQFMDATARDLETRYPELALLARASPRWAFRAQSLYLRDLRNAIAVYRDPCERMGFALQSYVGGLRWVLERQRLSRDPDVCLYMTCRINPGILPSNQREASEYPERIIDRWTPLYLSWGPGACWS